MSRRSTSLMCCPQEAPAAREPWLVLEIPKKVLAPLRRQRTRSRSEGTSTIVERLVSASDGIMDAAHSIATGKMCRGRPAPERSGGHAGLAGHGAAPPVEHRPPSIPGRAVGLRPSRRDSVRSPPGAWPSNVDEGALTGITGQDGSYLAELLLARATRCTASCAARARSTPSASTTSISDPHEPGARLTCTTAISPTARASAASSRRCSPDEVYNLGAQSHVRVSFDEPEYTADIVASGTLRLLEALRDYAAIAKTAVASTRPARRRCSAPPAAAERDDAVSPAQPVRREQGRRALVRRQLPRGLRSVRRQRHPVQPRDPPPRRDLRHAQDHARRRRASSGLQKKLYLGNLDAKRDWGFAGDYVEAMWLMLQERRPATTSVATGESHSVREFLEGRSVTSGSTGEHRRRSIRAISGPPRSISCCGDASKARRGLGWKPRVTFAELVRMMVDHDLELARQEKTLRDAGHVPQSRSRQ